MSDKNAWHFVGETLGDGRPIPEDSEWLEHDGELVMCESGLHASKRVIDALKYAPGNTICRVRVAGTIVEDNDKMVASKRKILWRIDGEALLRAFARWCALQVIHLWDAPDAVLAYLRTGRDAARSAAWDAARAVAWDAAWSVAWSAARDAARSAAWSAARSAAWSAAYDAAWSAARSAAWDAAWSAAYDAARSAAWNAQEKQLLKMIKEARAGKTEWVFEALLGADGWRKESLASDARLREDGEG